MCLLSSPFRPSPLYLYDNRCSRQTYLRLNVARTQESKESQVTTTAASLIKMEGVCVLKKHAECSKPIIVMMLY